MRIQSVEGIKMRNLFFLRVLVGRRDFALGVAGFLFFLTRGVFAASSPPITLTEALAHAQKASLLAKAKSTDDALREWQAAERCSISNDYALERALAEASYNVHEVPSAILHCERCLSLEKLSGNHPDAIGFFERKLQFLRERTTIHYFKMAMPVEF